jgi:hypothetical protein
VAKTGYVWDGTQFVSISSPIAAVPNAVVTYDSVAPTSPRTGQLWINSSTTTMYVYNGSSWVLAAAATATIPSINLNSNVIAADYTMPVGYNGTSAGPITVNSGVTVTIPSGSVWTVV